MTEILIIDDKPSEGLAGLLKATWRHPSKVTEQEVLDADLIVIDQYLPDWRFDKGSPATTHPKGGLAVAAVLRSQLEKCTPLVVFTGGLDNLGRYLPKQIRRPVLATSFGVEWVASRNDESLAEHLTELAEAARKLPTTWNTCGSLDAALAEWLRLPDDAEWRANALVDVRECRPSTTGGAGDLPGMVFLRWFLHQILPFPTFLLDASRSAVRLGLQPSAFDEILGDEDSDLARRILGARYEGNLSGFLGERYWRAGIDGVLEESEGWARGEFSDVEAMEEIHGGPVSALGDGVWRVPLDGELNPLEPRRVDELTRILPDHWPAFADDAYALSEDVDGDERIATWQARLL